MKICVAAICRNEEKNMEAWLNHVSKADGICVVDTGSQDGTVQILGKFDHPNFHLMFDYADERNLGASRNLAATPFPDNALIVWLDIDERFDDDNWVDALRAMPNIAQADSVSITMHNGNSTYYQKKAYRKKLYDWKYRAHEVLMSRNPDSHNRVTLTAPFATNHYPDLDKERNYLYELALDVRDDPRDSRSSFYYARELCYRVIHGGTSDLYDDAVREVNRLTGFAEWKDYISLAHTELLRAAYVVQDMPQVIASGYMSIAQRPDRIESYGTFSDAFYRLGDNVSALSMAIQGIAAPNAESLLFDTAQSNLDLCYDVAYLACIELNLLTEALHYLANRSTLRGEDVNQSIANSGLVERINQSRSGAIPTETSEVEVEGDSESEASRPQASDSKQEQHQGDSNEQQSPAETQDSSQA
ncbi:beta-1 protein [Yersinia phage fHe-Yen9-02]|nr:beta-1 protein [Yersinia phage fHe-Yen9-02]